MTNKMKPVDYSANERIRFHAGAEIDGEICVVGGFDALPMHEPYNRIFSYKPTRPDPWMFIDVEAYVHTVISGRFEDGGPEFFILASNEGEIWALGAPGDGFSEVIPGAGSLYEDARYGDVMSINWVGRSVYAVGFSCQIHRRAGRDGEWELISANILDDPFHILGVAGSAENDVYILRRPNSDNADYNPADFRGQILHSSGGDWQVVWEGQEAVTAGPTLLSDGDIAFGGLDGMVFKGNRKRGFDVFSRGDNGPGIVSLAHVRDKFFVADGQLLLAEDGRTEIVRTQLRPERESSIYLSSRQDSVLSVGYYDILKSIDERWERIVFPGNDLVKPDTNWSDC